MAQEACIRLTDIRRPVFRGREVSAFRSRIPGRDLCRGEIRIHIRGYGLCRRTVCIRRNGFHRNRNRRSFRRRTSTEEVKSISNCS